MTTVLDGLRRQRWWLARIAALPVHLFVFVIATFFLVRAVPGDPVLILLGQNYTPETYAALQAQLGLDGSLLAQLGSYLANVARLDLGDSLMTGRPVLTEIRDRLPATLELAFLALACSILVSIAAAYFVVMKPANPVSRVVRGYARAAGAIPEYVLAIVAIFVFYATLRWAPAPVGRLAIDVVAPLPITGFPLLDALLDGNPEAFASILGHLVLPVGVMVLAQSALLVKLLVHGLEEQLDAPPTLFRIASGAPRRAAVASAFRRAAPPVVTMAGTLFGYLLGGAVVLESLFGFTGMGQYAVDAMNTGDVIATQGFLLVIAALALVVFLVVDLLNMIVDPRRRPGVGTEGN
ncbi:ABC transporter permease [Pseudonocardia sp. WMMC193]|uniref:ABC transporter permease n=1 Tax=Pseudonocardia sp. WMMC193 TaxID=2911965 RepID=UPI001F415EA8|nr:ABC transporter permease [Pseudonocardia sp. WMMC193]MCF7550456.1 ABC transporter permease [Pseudonocardia sp. WMMC193]